MNSFITVRSIDVGFGDVKHVVDHRDGEPIECGSFPSMVARPAIQDLSGGSISARDTVVVTVKDTPYEVGPDVHLALGTHTARIVHKNFTAQPEYLALLRGALHYMATPQIDLLVVGLPVSDLATKTALIKNRLQGRHPTVGAESVNVGKVLVLAQPVGGLIDFSLSRGDYGQLRDSMNLVVDPGFFTFDWVLARGIQPIPARSGSYPGGVHAVLRLLAQVLSEELRVDLSDYTQLNQGLRSGFLRLFGREFPLADYLPAVQPVIEEAINALVNSVGPGYDIDHIVLVGGGASLFRSAIERRFPSHRVRVSDDSVYANVRGFQLAGEEIAQRKRIAVT